MKRVLDGKKALRSAAKKTLFRNSFFHFEIPFFTVNGKIQNLVKKYKYKENY